MGLTILRTLTAATAIALPLIAISSQRANAQDYYGAIARSPSTWAHGYSYDYANQRAAETRALRECESQSGTGDCEVMVWFRNACGALAEASNGAAGSGWGSEREIAEDYAMQSCYDVGDRTCRITRWVCTTR
ncbi:MAG: DUF4189 domain-containing protein [Leptolyngbyaceae cyanobacterium]